MKVIIVGGGLVGALSGCYFGKGGNEVHIYEYRNDLRNDKVAEGKSFNLALSTRGLEALKKVGLRDVVLSQSIPMKGRMIHSVDGKRKSILYDPVHNNCIYSVSRKRLNEILITEAEKYENVYLHFNNKILTIDFEEKKIIYKRSDWDGPDLKDVGDLIIGADGAHSVVRREMMKRPMYNFSQTYIEHGYNELTIPAENNDKMEPNHLHIWPRNDFMLIALPNLDRSWTVTLFMPISKFDEILGKESAIISFFQSNFPDALLYIGKSTLLQNFTKPSYLVSIKCSKYNIGGKCVLIGDAAHAMVPFYGQGMNAGLEDCRLLDEIIQIVENNLEEALNKYSKTRSRNGEAICDLAIYNYVEMRDLVNRPSYLLRKKLDNLFYWFLSNKWIPLYQSVTFTNIPYQKCMENRSWQNKVLRNIFYSLGILLSSSVIYIIQKIYNEI